MCHILSLCPCCPSRCCQSDCCQCADTEVLNCCCLEIRLRKSDKQSHDPHTASQSYSPSTPPLSARSLSQLHFISSKDLCIQTDTLSKDFDEVNHNVKKRPLKKPRPKEKSSSQRLLPAPPTSTKGNSYSSSDEKNKSKVKAKSSALTKPSQVKNRGQVIKKKPKPKLNVASELVEIAVENTYSIVIPSLNFSSSLDTVFPHSFQGPQTSSSVVYGPEVFPVQGVLSNTAPIGRKSSRPRPLPSRPPT